MCGRPANSRERLYGFTNDVPTHEKPHYGELGPVQICGTCTCQSVLRRGIQTLQQASLTGATNAPIAAPRD